MIAFEALSPFGVEVDLDLSRAPAPEQQDELRQLFHAHHLLVLRGQRLTRPRQMDVMSIFGPVLPAERDGSGYVSLDPTRGSLGSTALAFHSDLAFSPEPFLGASLHAIDVEDGATSTLFASGTDAYRRLDPSLRRRLEGRVALHVFPLDQGRRSRDAETPPGFPRCEHPVLWPHPVTGEPIVYVNEQTDSIVGLPAEESEEIIQRLFADMYAPENVYEHWWTTGDLVIWDNLALQHGRADQSARHRRTLQKVTLARVGFYEQHPQFVRDDTAHHGARLAG